GEQHLLAVGGVPEFQPGLQVVVVVPGGGEVGADGHAHGAVVASADAQGDRQARGVAVGGEDEGCAEGADAAFGVFGLDSDDAVAALVDDGRGDVGAFQEPHTGFHGVAGEDLVEVVAGAYQTESGVFRKFRPGKLESGSAADDAEAAVADPAVFFVDGDPHSDELFDCTGGEAVSADLLPRESSLLQQQDV